MPENIDVLKRLEGMEAQLSAGLEGVNTQLQKLHDVLVKLAEQQKDIDHLSVEVTRLRVKFEDDVEKRLKSLEKIQDSCPIKAVEKSVSKIWAAVGTIIFILISATINKLWVK